MTDSFDIRFAPAEEREDVAQFMSEAFPRAKWGMESWRALLDGRWSRSDTPGGDETPFAVTARHKGRLVGVLGLVTAHRHTPRGPRLTVDMTSWYILKPYRRTGLGHDMLRHAMSVPGGTISNFTSSPKAVSVLLNAGLEVLETTRLLWRPDRGDAKRVMLHHDGAAFDALPEFSREMLKDHEGTKLQPVVAQTPAGASLLMICPEQKHPDHLNFEVYHVSDPEIFAAHAADIATALLPGEGTVMSCDKRLSGGAEADATELLRVNRFYSPGHMQPDEIDPLYSELMILKIKLS